MVRTDSKNAARVMDEVNSVILGKEDAVREIMTAFIANGHILLNDVPGVGKTTLALAFSRAMNLSCRRVQFTPDVMPSDLTGFSVYSREREKFVYQPGAVFCNILLADEINRTSPKTQSALLEVMEERRVTVEGIGRAVPDPFMVIATENPLGSIGTQPLPESQLDRFMISMSVGYPDRRSEIEMARSVSYESRTDDIAPVLSGEELVSIQHNVHDIFISDAVLEYIVDLVTATRKDPDLAFGAGPRATVSLVAMAKASAWLDGRVFVIPQDAAAQFHYVAGHRISLSRSGRAAHMTAEDVLSDILDRTRQPVMSR